MPLRAIGQNLCTKSTRASNTLNRDVPLLPSASLSLPYVCPPAGNRGPAVVSIITLISGFSTGTRPGAAMFNRSIKLVELCFPRPADGESTEFRLSGDHLSPLPPSSRLDVCGDAGNGDPICATLIGLDRVITFVE